MNLKRIILGATAIILASTLMHAQEITMRMQNISVKKAMTELQKSTGYSFVYMSDDLDTRKNINVDASTLNQAVEQILYGQNVGYEIHGKNIVVKKLTPTAAGTASSTETIYVTGVVKDAEGNPLPGANIVSELNSGLRTVADIDGRFQIRVPKGSYVRVSYIGFKPVALKAADKLDVALTEDTQALDEVVVVGYGQQKKVNLTGSVSSISSSQLKDKPVAMTSQAIAGLAPGLSVLQNSGRPGTGTNIKIRGTGTFSGAGTDPLILIDGMAGGIDDINPNDIESISILKDAASASIYGNRAANGVILIETKKGHIGKIKVSYSNQFGWQRPTETPDFLPSWEYATYYNEAQRNMGNSEVYSAEQIQKYRDGSDPDNYPNVNHLDWLLNSGSGFQQRHTLGIKGGNERLSYNLSVGVMSQDGMTAKTNNTRYTVLYTMKSLLTKGLTLNMNINAYANSYKAPNSSEKSIDGIVGFAVREGPIYAGEKSDGTFGYQDNYSPEAWLASKSFFKGLSSNIAASGQLTWDTPVKGLSFSGRFGLQYFNTYNKSFWAQTKFDEYKTVGPASLDITSSNSLYKIFEALARYNRTFSKHTVGLLVGTSFEDYTNRWVNGSRNTFPNNNLYELPAGSPSTSANGSDESSYALASFFGRLNYSFNDRYLLEMNIRVDGSSRFAPDRRWGVFPSFSAGWRISQEPFWEGLRDKIENLKIRASWGKLGNQNIGYYPYQQVYSTQGWEYPFGGNLQPGVNVTTYNNRNITWEKTSVTDIGLDFSIHNGTFTGSIDYFNKYTSDILSWVERTLILGRGTGQSNVGEVSNKGMEIQLTYNGHIGRDFRFSISPNFTYVKNAVEKLADGKQEEINSGRIVGEPLGIIWGFKTDGLFVDQDEIDNAPDQIVSKSRIKPGYIRYRDISGPDGVPDGKVDYNNDRCILGSTTPKYYYGLTLTAQYKGFDFSALLQGLGGHKRLIGSYMAYAFYNGGQIQRWQVENRWTEANPDKWAKYPRLETMNGGNPNMDTSDYWVRNASFLRIKNIQLGYSLPTDLISKVGMSQCRIYVSCENLHNFSSFYKGWDPENEIGLGDSPSYYPLNRIISFGLNLNF